MSLGSRIATAVRRERERAGVSAAELARRSGVSKATISQIEAGSANPNVETLWAIATALGAPAEVRAEEAARRDSRDGASDCAVMNFGFITPKC